MRERRDRSKWGSSAGRSRTLAVALVVAVVVPAMALASGGSATANTGKAARTTSSAAQPVNPLGDLPISIEKFALKEHSDSYGGIVATHGATHLVVYLTRLNPRVEAEIRSRVPAGVVSFALTSHSAAYVRQVHQAVTNSAQRLAAVGTQLVQWGPDTQGGVESIGVLNLTKQDTQRLHAMFGVDNIRVYNVPLSDVPKATNVDRQNDTSPYNGGDAITNHVGGCTSGFGVTISGKTYLLTAAHCFLPGDNIYNELWPIPRGDNNNLGSEWKRDVAYGGQDSAVLNVRGSDLIWTGAIGNPQRSLVAGWDFIVDGYQVCQSGAYSGEVCSTVQHHANCIWVSDYAGLSGDRYECGVAYATASSGGIANQGGDSGGPVFRFEGGGLYAQGIVSASDESSAHQVTCQHYADESGCYDNMYFTAMKPQLDEWNATINTG